MSLKGLIRNEIWMCVISPFFQKKYGMRITTCNLSIYIVHPTLLKARANFGIFQVFHLPCRVFHLPSAKWPWHLQGWEKERSRQKNFFVTSFINVKINEWFYKTYKYKTIVGLYTKFCKKNFALKPKMLKKVTGLVYLNWNKFSKRKNKNKRIVRQLIR